MGKKFARYYYVPICTESFASLNRLKEFFSELENEVDFLAINISSDDVVINNTYKTNERKFIEDLNNNRQLLKYGKLFVNDIEILGFPPASKYIKEVFVELKINADYKSLKSPYNLPVGKKENFEEKNFKTIKLDEKNCNDICLLCTKYNRYILEDNYIKDDWEKPEQAKSKHLIESMKAKKIIAFIEYYNDEAVAFIEGYDKINASKYGFIINEKVDSCMITCLHIREEASGNGISKKLISKFLNEAKEIGYKSVEVISYPDEINWQPKSLFKKMGFTLVREIDKTSLMRINL